MRARSGGGRLRRVAARLLAALALPGCAGLVAPPDPLAELHPYLWLQEGRLVALTCRWPAGAPIPVAVAPGAGPEDEVLLGDALAALRGLGLPVALVRAPAEAPAAITVAFEPGPVARAAGAGGSGRTDAVCAYDPATGRAELAAARVRVARSAGPDARGRERPLAPEERLGTLLHELGHALGFQGHPRRADPLLEAAPEAVRRLGRRAARGEPLSSRGLAALYAAPSGRVLGRWRVETWRSAPVDALAAQARDAGWTGPYLRAGDRAARISWLAGPDREPAAVLPEIERILRRPAEVLAVPVPEPAGADPGSADPGPKASESAGDAHEGVREPAAGR